MFIMFKALNHYNNPKNVSTICIPLLQLKKKMKLGEVTKVTQVLSGKVRLTNSESLNPEAVLLITMLYYIPLVEEKD